MQEQGISMEKFNVYVVEKSYADYTLEQEIIEKAGGKILFAHCRSEEDIIQQCGDAHALLLRQTPIGEHAFKRLNRLRVVSRYGVGYDNVDVQSATRHSVLVTIVPDYCTCEVADHTIALLMSSIRRIPFRDRFVRSGGWEVNSDYPVYRTNKKILGFVGYGKTAREVRKRLAGFPFRFIANDPYVSRDIYAQDNTLSMDFQSLIMMSHYISIHVPLNESTYHLFNLSTFRKMRRGSILINTSRGQVIDMKELYTALKEGFISGAALDVYETEPLNPKNPINTLDSVILSNHASWYSEESQKELQIRTALEAARVLTGTPPENPVNPEVLQTRINYFKNRDMARQKVTESEFQVSYALE
jgi:D-3-phosphoglycerate dehydrogenase